MSRISRKEWGARPPRGVDRLPWAAIDTLYVHYTAAESDRSGDPRVRARGIQNYHMDTKGWRDVAYTHGFTDEGDVVELRGWEVHTAATGIENDHSQALVFFGADKEGRDDVTPRGRQALRGLVNEALDLKRGPLAVKGHTEARDPAGQTDCPGRELLAYIHFQNGQGWRLEKRFRYPHRFFTFAAWYLGEGPYKEFGPRNRAAYPDELFQRRIPARYWVALRYFLAQRKRKGG